jgi:Amt family ammonium transporter
MVLGKRYNASHEMKPHNTPLVVLGASLLWFGWFGFNAGSAGGALNGSPFASVASLAFINTHTATAAAALSWMFVEKFVAGAPTASGASAGAVAGLVAITPACGYVSMWSALIIGIVTPPVCIGGIWLKGKMGLDDTLDAFAVHGLGGVMGALLTGLFADPGLNYGVGAFYGNDGWLLAYQLAAVCTSATFSFVGTLIIMLVLKYTIGIRVSEDAEKMGIDLSEHGAKAYMGPAATAEQNKLSGT